MHWHWIFPLIATFWYLKYCSDNMDGRATDIYVPAYFGIPYVIFWLTYLLILHW